MDDPHAERRLVERARTGDPDAWELLYRRAYPRLVAYARRRLATPDQAEEAVSETMARAMDTIDRYVDTHRRGGAGIEGWLFGIARNVVLEAYRSGARHRAGTASLEPAPAGNPPEEAVLDAEERTLLVRAFERLSEADRDLLELRVLAGLDATRVGELTGRRAGAVRTAQSRALARLRVEYEGLMA
jgi:RNA polymerase sigma-70 factor, ECF subfamily